MLLPLTEKPLEKGVEKHYKKIEKNEKNFINANKIHITRALYK